MSTHEPRPRYASRLTLRAAAGAPGPASDDAAGPDMPRANAHSSAAVMARCLPPNGKMAPTRMGAGLYHSRNQTIQTFRSRTRRCVAAPFIFHAVTRVREGSTVD